MKTTQWTISLFPVVFSLAFVLSACGGGGVSEPTSNAPSSPPTTGVLTINIVDLPANTPSNVTLIGADGSTNSVAGSASLTLSPGAYTLNANPVLTSAASYYPLVSSQSITITSSLAVTVSVDYKNVIPNTTKIPSPTDLSSLTISSDTTMLTMPASSSFAQSLAVGNVIAIPPTSSAPMGMLRKIASVSDANSQITATTQPATLADAFQRLSFQIQNQLSSQSIRSVHTAPNVTFHRGAFLHRSANSGGSSATVLSDPCDGFSLGIFDVSKMINADVDSSLTLTGQVEVCSGLNLSIDLIGTGFLGLQPQLNGLTASATMGEFADLQLQGTFLEGSFDPDPIVLGTIEFPPIEIPGLPIWITPNVTVLVGAKGDLSSGFSGEAMSSGTFTRGVSWAGGMWTPIQPAPSFQFQNTQPVIDASLSAKAYAGIKCDLYLYDSIGPSFQPDGYLQFNADITQNPWWTLTGGIEGPMSFDVTILGENLASYDLGTMFDYSKLIASSGGPFSPAMSAPVVTTLSPQQVIAGSGDFNLTISGTNFVPGAEVNFGSQLISAVWVNSSQLTTIIPSASVSSPGTVNVSVTNPGAQNSNSLNFTISPPAVTLSINPTLVIVPQAGIQTFSANVSGGSVTWSVEEGAIGGTITSAGIYTAPNTPGTFHAVATSTADASQSATATITVVPGPTVTTIHSFDHATEGANPWVALIQGSDGNFYGTTASGGDLNCSEDQSSPGCGTLFKMDAAGNTTVLHAFSGSPDGIDPVAPLLQASDQNFYGITTFGGANLSACDFGGTSTLSGCGTIFKLDSSNNLTILHSFSSFTAPDGVGPEAGLIQGSDGKLYGSAVEGANSACNGTLGSGVIQGCGDIFSSDTSGNLTPLNTFTGSNGAYPSAALVQGSDGNFYGVTGGGGSTTCTSFASLGCGTIFEMSASGTINILHIFTGQDGTFPNGALIQAKDGNFYGTTVFGGSSTCTGGAQWQGCGVIFKIDSTMNMKVLHSFSGIDGAYPNAALIQASDGNFYGSTQGGGSSACTGRYGPGCGTIFKMDASGNVTVLYSFMGGTDGSWPESSLLQASDGNLYGTAVFGGAMDDGVVFQVSDLESLVPGALPRATSQTKQVRAKATAIYSNRLHQAPTIPISSMNQKSRRN